MNRGEEQFREKSGQVLIRTKKLCVSKQSPYGFFTRFSGPIAELYPIDPELVRDESVRFRWSDARSKRLDNRPTVEQLEENESRLERYGISRRTDVSVE